ncbi:aldose epimerase family protein [Prosthecomicrobium sp. N25]|uniref:aldose epimerase family protein n=1 Tax=Prosthecomicrobium sp. N25 TaxID=3129254 RepID=UPI003077937A
MDLEDIFGFMPDGTPVPRVTIAGEDLRVELIGYGASIRDLLVGGRPVVLGLDTLEDYVAHSSHMGAVAGRYANRIRNGRFTLDGVEQQLVLNQAGRHHLHGGGNTGFGKRPWKLLARTPRSALFGFSSPDGDQGYPGAVEARIRYEVAGPGLLRMELTATTDAPTIVNLATHSYFNLDGDGSVLDHILEIPAETYTPVDADLIPTGAIAPVAGTPFDFRSPRPIRHLAEGAHVGYDHNFVVARERAAEPRLMARAAGPKTGIRLEVWSTEPGVQFYDATKMNVPVTGTHGRHFGANAGFCLEPQLFPDTPNNPGFGSAVLRPGQTYRQLTEYRFEGP